MDLPQHRRRRTTGGRWRAALAAATVAALVAVPLSGSSALLPVSVAHADAEGTPLAPSVTVSTPSTDDCARRSAPATSESDADFVGGDRRAPADLPVPIDPVGGRALGNCGITTPRGSAPLPIDISASAWMISDLDTGDVLAAKDPHGRYRPASTLKLLTMNVLLADLKNLDRVVIGTDADTEQAGSRVGLGAGGRYTVRQLMLFLMMGSGNDVAHALAVADGGEPAILARMNARAKALGAFDTRAATVSGLDGPGQSTSVYDLALITRADMRVAPFPELVATKYSQVPGFSQYPAFGIASDNALLFGYQGALGGKNGYTTSAGNTYVGMAERDGHRFIITMLGGSQEPRRQWMQAASMLDWAFALPDGTTGIGYLVSPGAQAGGSTGGAGPASTPSTAEESGRLTFGGTDDDRGGPAAPLTTRSSAVAAAGSSDGSGSSATAVVVWIILAALAALAVLVVVAGLRGSDRHSASRHGEHTLH